MQLTKAIVGFVTVALLAATPAAAAVITIDVTSGGGGVILNSGSVSGTGIGAYLEEGFTLQTLADANHVDLFGVSGSPTWSTSFGNPPNVLPWHRGGSNPIDPNILEGTYVGGAFDLLSLDVVQNINGLTFTSNLGGLLSLTAGVTGNVVFSGATWENIAWVRMLIGPGDPSGDLGMHIIDNLRFDNAVPEPASVLLLALGAGAIVGRTRYARRRG